MISTPIDTVRPRFRPLVRAEYNIGPGLARTCPRWFASRAALTLAHAVWVTAMTPHALPLVAFVTPLSIAILISERHREAPRLAAWLSATSVILAAIQLAVSNDPLVVGLGAAIFAAGTMTLFAAQTPRLAVASMPFVSLLAAVLSVLTTAAHPAAFAWAAALGLFFGLRPLSAFARVLASLGLHRGPADPLLLWDPLGDSPRKPLRSITPPEVH